MKSISQGGFMTRVSRSALALCAVALTAAGCGSTVSLTPGASEANLPGLGAAASPEGPSTTNLSGPAGGNQVVSQAGGGSTIGTATNDPSATSPGVLDSPGATASGLPFGVTPTQIFVGLVRHINGYNAAGGGFSSSTQRSPQEQMLTRINASGGIGGRKLIAVPYEVDDSSSVRDPNTEAQAQCATWTQDHHVFAVIDQGDPSGIVLRCTAAKHLIFIGGQLAQYDASAFAINPYYFLSAGVDITSTMKIYVDGLANQKFVTSTSKVGMLTFDTPYYSNALKQGYFPAMKQHGFKATSTVQVRYPQTESELGELSSQVSQAVLKFRSAGVDRVMIEDIAGTLGLLFMTAAEGQHYRPLYGLNSQSAPAELVNGGPSGSNLVPLAQLVGSVGVGWLPISDINQGMAFAPGYQSCLKQLGVATSSDYNSRSFAAEACTEVRLLVAGIRGAGTIPTSQGVSRVLETLGHGANFTDGATTYQTGFASGKHFGVNGVRYSHFDTGCSCYRYSSPGTFAVS